MVLNDMSEDTITQKELQEAMERKHWQLTAERAASIFKDIKEHREPQWEEGDLVSDALGIKWVYHNLGWDMVWVPPAAIMTGFTITKPARPLKRYRLEVK